MLDLGVFIIEGGDLKVRDLFVKNLRFGCTRCAIFCCKLGGPELTERDIGRLERSGHFRGSFVEESKRSDRLSRSLKNRAGGECFFLVFNRYKGFYGCQVYEHRPLLCRMYPFSLKRVSETEFVLGVLPCLGLGYSRGRVVNQRFVLTRLKPLIMELLDFQGLYKN